MMTSTDEQQNIKQIRQIQAATARTSWELHRLRDRRMQEIRQASPFSLPFNPACPSNQEHGA